MDMLPQKKLVFRRPRPGVMRIEVRPDVRVRRLAWGGVLLLTVAGYFLNGPLILLLPVACVLFAGNPCIQISNQRLVYGTSFFGLFLMDESLPLRAIKRVRADELRYRQWGLYRGLENDRDLLHVGANHAEPYLVFDEGIAEIKLPIGLDEETQQWLADYLDGFIRTARCH